MREEDVLSYHQRFGEDIRRVGDQGLLGFESFVHHSQDKLSSRFRHGDYDEFSLDASGKVEFLLLLAGLRVKESDLVI